MYRFGVSLTIRLPQRLNPSNGKARYQGGTGPVGRGAWHGAIRASQNGRKTDILSLPGSPPLNSKIEGVAT
jgi:hypothetical protein